ncbi:MAG TPA: T9SS type A sorting domain-containing protein, partial [Candidatus Kapabacteria bacterium]|nr:T9SS type A sorting domain-containing protein [Candidatus Kapabacteria bacterium]
RRYIETCYLEKDAPGEFLEITSAVQGMEAVGDTIWPEYRDWLRSVLYLNPDSTYFCADLAQYAGTFVPNWPKDYKSCLTILKYLADSSYCNYFHFYMTSIWESFQRYWQDTVKDATTTPFDSTLPNIDQIGQGWLRGLQRDVTSGAYDIYQNAITVFSAVKNPFTDELELHYTAIKPTVAKIEIYDALGRMLWTDGQGYLEPREHSVRIASKDWSSGAYYARIVTLQGEVKSVKLVKE